MHRTRVARILAVAACAAIGVSALALTTPPDEHAPKTTPAPAKASPKASPARPDNKELVTPKSEAAKPKADAKPAKEEPPHEPAADGSHDDDHAEAPAAAPSPAKAPAPKPAPAPNAEAATPTADEAIKMLREGNERWINNQVQAPNTDSARREECATAGQKPFVTVLTCADSRLPVERVFDRGVGDVFVVRVAGNVMTPEVAGTIEYGAEHLHVPLLVVMGHTKCGAVAAAASGAEVGGNVASLVEKIAPAVSRAKQQDPTLAPADLAALAVKENVWQGIFDLLRTSTEARTLVHEGKLKIVGAVCDVTTGRVEWLGSHPWQDALVEAFDARSKTAENSPATADASKEH
jgi:carbonic anhydrase